MSLINSLWTEKYRPSTSADCILPKHLIDAFETFVKNRDVPNILLSGRPGTGKTTVAKALCRDMECDVLVINGSDETGIDVLRNKIKTFASTLSLSGGRKVVILDEGENLNPNSTMPALRNFTEEYSNACRFILTANYKHKIIAPLMSRFTEFEFNIPANERADIAKAMIDKTKTILKTEGITEIDKSVLTKIVVKYFPDFRKTLAVIQQYVNTYGKLDLGMLAQTDDSNLSSLVAVLRKKDYFAVREWLVESPFLSQPEWLFTMMNTNCEKIFAKQSIPQAICHISDFDYKSKFVTDQEINTMALFVHLMADCQFVKE